jgi:cell wall assembly regulator SMI1
MMNITPWGENNEQAVQAFEQQIGFTLPDDYRQFLIKNNGAEVNSQTFFVKDLEQEVLMDVFYGITEVVRLGWTV